MCTRFYIEKENKKIQDIISMAENSPLAGRFLQKTGRSLLTFGEIRPTDLVAVIAPDRKGDKAVFPMKWGFTLPGKNSPVVNARVETAPEKPLFREHWQKHRCIIPASWYFEWEHFASQNSKRKTGRKFMIQSFDSSITYLCGLYHFEEDLPVFTILTRAPGEKLKELHDRMPLILPADKINQWIDIETVPDKLPDFSLTDLSFRPADSQLYSQLEFSALNSPFP